MKNVLTPDQIRLNRERFIELLESTGREGVSNVIKYLTEDTGFFTSISSRNRHHNWPGGLAQHCLGVYDKALVCGRMQGVPQDSLIIAALLHDICKADAFLPAALKDRPMTRKMKSVGRGKHGRRSLLMLEALGLKMSQEEKHAIEHHMHVEKFISSPLLRSIQIADSTDSFSSRFCRDLK